jgi:hypothetical protein
MLFNVLTQIVAKTWSLWQQNITIIHWNPVYIRFLTLLQ